MLLARSQDMILHSRVLDYRHGMGTLTYEQRKFFDWGGWLAVRPMDELPHWRVVMRHERDQPNWTSSSASTDRRSPRCAMSRERGTVSNRDFADARGTRNENYRGRKDSALALYYLWLTGEVMIFPREGFERVYALTETVAPRI